ncbi:hypothetical protein AMS62_14110 [Bacillus sp. FJAT-18019]|nr:hypothetical protein AMS62_14110 [Bacillus sp. FJAT-18019]
MKLLIKLVHRSSLNMQLICVFFIPLGLVFSLYFDFFPTETIKSITSDNFNTIVVFLLLYVSSHVLRIVRLFTLMIEKKVSLRDLFAIYFLTSWVNLFLPYKTGEIFRVFGFGSISGSLRKGIVVIWIERFFDALVLLFLIIPYLIYSKSPLVVMPIVLVLILFVLFTIFFFLEFPFSKKYLNKFIISHSKTRKGVRILKATQIIENIYEDMKALIRGRVSLILFISLMIWFLELWSVSYLFDFFSLNSLVGNFMILINESFMTTLKYNLNLLNAYRFLSIWTITILAIVSLILIVRRKPNWSNLFQKKSKERCYKLSDTYYEQQGE